MNVRAGNCGRFDEEMGTWRLLASGNEFQQEKSFQLTLGILFETLTGMKLRFGNAAVEIQTRAHSESPSIQHRS